MLTLRNYQKEAVAACWASCKQNKDPVIVLPTGAGKSLVIAQIIKDVAKYGLSVVVLAHRKELLQQNAAEIENLTGETVGIYSAGLNKRDIENKIIVAGIQSIYQRAYELGTRHVIIIDEAHLIPPKEQTMYGRFIADMKKVQPVLRLIGLTATPFRTEDGDIANMDGALFSEICYEAKVGDLIEQGYLSNVTTRPAENTVDTSGLPKARGEFALGVMESEFIKTAYVATEETTKLTLNRKSILVFTTGVKHAEIVRERITELTGEEVALITGNTPKQEREEAIAKFKSRQVRWLVNVNVLTTGFNATCIDAVVVMRATISASLFAQMVGRGLRLHEGKENCLVLDFGENVKRHGAIDEHDYGRKPKKNKTGGKAPTKQCPVCEELNPVVARVCKGCLTPFDIEENAKHKPKADVAVKILKQYGTEVRAFKVTDWTWAKHKGKGDKPDSLRVNYYVTEIGREGETPEGNLQSKQPISQWVCIEHEGFAYNKAKEWWKQVCSLPVPPDVQEALEVYDEQMARMPSRIFARRSDGFWRIVEMVFNTEMPSEPKPQTYTEADIPF